MGRPMTAILVLVTALIGMGRAAGRDAKLPPVPQMDNAASVTASLLSPEWQSYTLRQIELQRAETIKGLVAVVKMPDVDGSRGALFQQVVKLLGGLRAREAVEPLARRLMYLPRALVVDELSPREAYYPVARALIQIGDPSIPAMLDRIAKSDRQAEREVAAWVIMQIEGSKELAAHRLDIAATAEKHDRQARERLDAAEQFMLHYKPVFKPPRPTAPGSDPWPPWDSETRLGPSLDR